MGGRGDKTREHLRKGRNEPEQGKGELERGREDGGKGGVSKH